METASTSRAKEGLYCMLYLYQENVLLHTVYYYTTHGRKLRTGVWLIKKVGVEELDVLREQYERPARCRK